MCLLSDDTEARPGSRLHLGSRFQKVAKPGLLHVTKKRVVIEVLNRLHAGRVCGANVFLAVVQKQYVGSVHPKTLGGVRVDRRVGLGGQQPMRERVMGEIVQPGATAQDAGLHGVAQIGKNAGPYAGRLQARGPVDHGLVWLRPQGRVRVDQLARLLGGKLPAKVLGDMVPIRLPVQHAAVVVVPIAPVRVVEGRVGGVKDLLHLRPGGGVGRTGKDEAVVEEHGFDRRGLRVGGHLGSMGAKGGGGVKKAGRPDSYAERMRFSERTAWEPGVNAWAEAAEVLRTSGREVLDLTVSNPTACGLGPASASVLAPLGDPGALRYSPDPLGMAVAREAVAAYYRDHGAVVDPGRICMTTSTSEAYSFLFRLLCDPGDEVLIARPSYPLFDLLAKLDDVVVREYPLFYEPGPDAGWSIDFASLQALVNDKTRAVVTVHPNNPTGNYVREDDRQALEVFCAENGLALLVDEVFLDYALDAERCTNTFATGTKCLSFVLSGISKVCALPQMKASWIAATGPSDLVSEAMRRLEIVADTFLSMNAPVQCALPSWLAARDAVQQNIRERMQMNLAALDQRLAGSLGDRLHLEGGWTAVLRVPRHVDGEEFALAAMRRGVLVQPGVFYGLPEGRCVVSLLTEPDIWRRGLEQLPL